MRDQSPPEQVVPTWSAVVARRFGQMLVATVMTAAVLWMFADLFAPRWEFAAPLCALVIVLFLFVPFGLTRDERDLTKKRLELLAVSKQLDTALRSALAAEEFNRAFGLHGTVISVIEAAVRDYRDVFTETERIAALGPGEKTIQALDRFHLELAEHREKVRTAHVRFVTLCRLAAAQGHPEMDLQECLISIERKERQAAASVPAKAT